MRWYVLWSHYRPLGHWLGATLYFAQYYGVPGVRRLWFSTVGTQLVGAVTSGVQYDYGLGAFKICVGSYMLDAKSESCGQLHIQMIQFTGDLLDRADGVSM